MELESVVVARRFFEEAGLCVAAIRGAPRPQVCGGLSRGFLCGVATAAGVAVLGVSHGPKGRGYFGRKGVEMHVEVVFGRPLALVSACRVWKSAPQQGLYVFWH